jgi:hypothetical protein
VKNPLAVATVLFSLVAAASAQVPQLIRRGNVLSWSAQSGHGGLMKIVSVDGLYFEVEQTNDNNRAAGIVRLQGAVIDNGQKVVLINGGQWKEVWEGRVFGDEIIGKLAAGNEFLNFRITAGAVPAAAADPILSTAPFIPGRTLRWGNESNGGQSGTFFVVSAKGSTFTLEQTNVRNPSAGITRMDGEIKGGMVYIYNRKWKETWVGIFEHGHVTGRVNNDIPFRIFE